jgi:hypothetical protein
MNVLSLRKCTIHSAWEIAGIKMKGKKLQEISENKPDTGFVKVQILFFAQRPVCVCICVQIWIFPIF